MITWYWGTCKWWNPVSSQEFLYLCILCAGGISIGGCISWHSLKTTCIADVLYGTIPILCLTSSINAEIYAYFDFFKFLIMQDSQMHECNAYQVTC